MRQRDAVLKRLSKQRHFRLLNIYAPQLGRIFYNSLKASIFFSGMLTSINSVANENASKHNSIEEIIVSGLLPESMHRLASSASLITAEDIAQSGANSLPELLSRLANVTLRSYSGNAKSTSIDIRGSGATSISNVLILIDGMRINSSDLGGVDFSVVNLEHIERIEVIRGGNSVRYGGGASHGIVNIITKNNSNEDIRMIKLSAGQHDDYKINVGIQTTTDEQYFSMGVSSAKSIGYRRHNRLNQEDLTFNYEKTFENKDNIRLNSRLHRDEYQLPGNLCHPDNIDPNNEDQRCRSYNRRYGSIGNGYEGKTSDDAQFIQYKKNIGTRLNLTNRISYRGKEKIFKRGEALKTTELNKRNRIEQKTTRIETLFEWQNKSNKLYLFSGFINEETDYWQSRGNGQYHADSEIFEGDLHTNAKFISLSFEPKKNIALEIGYRDSTSKHTLQESVFKEKEDSNQCQTRPRGEYEQKFNCPIFLKQEKSSKHTWENEAIDFRGRFNIHPEINAYVSVSKTFRNPNVDELIKPDDDIENHTLSPQKKQNFEAGLKIHNDTYLFNIGFFRSTTKDEILFREIITTTGDSIGINLNAENPITRTGAELQSRYFLSDDTEINLDLGYIDVSTGDNQRIPLVPYWTIATGVNWQIKSTSNLNIYANYTGQRLDGNHTTNVPYKKIDSYLTVNAKYIHREKLFFKEEFNWYVSLNNIFNTPYLHTAYSEFVYPAPLRSIEGGISFAF